MWRAGTGEAKTAWMRWTGLERGNSARWRWRWKGEKQRNEEDVKLCEEKRPGSWRMWKKEGRTREEKV
jgi:hypothetical protein